MIARIELWSRVGSQTHPPRLLHLHVGSHKSTRWHWRNSLTYSSTRDPCRTLSSLDPLDKLCSISRLRSRLTYCRHDILNRQCPSLACSRNRSVAELGFESLLGRFTHDWIIAARSESWRRPRKRGGVNVMKDRHEWYQYLKVQSWVWQRAAPVCDGSDGMMLNSVAGIRCRELGRRTMTRSYAGVETELWFVPDLSTGAYKPVGMEEMMRAE